MGRTRLAVVKVRKTGVPELSAVAIARGRIYVADDERGIGVLGPRGVRFEANGELDGLEGLCADPSGRTLYAIGEDSRRLHRLPIARDGSLRPVRDSAKLPRPGKSKKKGWEGAAWLPRAQNPEKRDRLVLVNEARPRCVALFDPGDPDDHVFLDLPEELRDALDDLSDVAVEPATGLLWLLSDESSALGIAALVKREAGAPSLEAREVVALPVKDAQSEAIVFDGRRLLLGSEEGGLLHTLEIRRR
jgi:uncharacterized protein YjiK